MRSRCELVFFLFDADAFLAWTTLLTDICFSSNRNWGIAMFAGVAIVCVVNYLVYARKFYKGPVVHVKSI